MIKTFSNLDKTHCQKGLKVPYFVTEVIFGQKFINLLQKHTMKFNGIYVIFGIMP